MAPRDAQGPFREERGDKCGYVSYHEHNTHGQMHATAHMVCNSGGISQYGSYGGPLSGQQSSPPPPAKAQCVAALTRAAARSIALCDAAPRLDAVAARRIRKAGRPPGAVPVWTRPAAVGWVTIDCMEPMVKSPTRNVVRLSSSNARCGPRTCRSCPRPRPTTKRGRLAQAQLRPTAPTSPGKRWLGQQTPRCLQPRHRVRSMSMPR